MLMKTAREQIVSYGNRLIEDGLTVGTAGNISVYDPESGYMAISRLEFHTRTLCRKIL